MTPETKALIADFQQRIAQGPSAYTLAELKDVYARMREDRVSAATASAASRTRKAPVDAESLLKELEDM